MNALKAEAQEALAKAFDVRGLFRHYKGGAYIVYSVSINETDGERMVHYYSIDRKSRWTRTWKNFFSDSPIDPTRERFTLMRAATVEELRLAAGCE